MQNFSVSVRIRCNESSSLVNEEAGFVLLNTGLYFKSFIKTKNLLVLVYCNLLLSSNCLHMHQTFTPFGAS